MAQLLARTTYSPYMQHAKRDVSKSIRLDASGVLPFELNDELRDELVADLARNSAISIHGHYGYPPLLEALAQKSGLESPECVVTAAGSSMGNHLAMAAVLQEPGDGVLIEAPAYPLLAETARYMRADVRHFRREPDGELRAEQVHEAIGRAGLHRLRLIVLTNLHNPTGALADETTLREIGAIAKQHDAHVLVDEVYLDTVFEATPRSAFHLSPRFITTNSLTKSYGLNGLRCGWILAEPALARRIWDLTDLFDVEPPHIAERLSVIALRHLLRLRERARQLLTINRSLLNDFLASRPELDTPVRPYGTVAFPRLREGDAASFCSLLQERYGTSVTDGAFFGAPDHIRIGIGAASETVREGLERLRVALDDVVR